jgi:16S rRNA pseudouridine516 synthase
MSAMTLDRLLQSQGFGSRKYCRQLVRNGEVEVGGVPVVRFDHAYETEGFEFRVFGETWIYRASVYIALHKPSDYECSRKPSHHPGVLSLLPEQFRWREVQPVGRLDHDTTGLLLLSDDGEFIHSQSSPRRHVAKIYVATTHAPVDAALVESLLGGVQLHDEPAPLRALSCRVIDERRVEIVLEQGKYHQVKRMLAAAGNHCEALCRVAIGGLTLESLALDVGQWCYLDPAQRVLLVPADQAPAR